MTQIEESNYRLCIANILAAGARPPSHLFPLNARPLDKSPRWFGVCLHLIFNKSIESRQTLSSKMKVHLCFIFIVSNVSILLQPSESSSLKYEMKSSWSNRLGVNLTPITSGVWAAERPFTWNKIDVGGRSLICRMTDGSLLVHSPVEWTEQLAESIDSLGGKVGFVISPNYEHLKFANQWNDKYPNAKMVACPGLPLRILDVPWSLELTVDEVSSVFMDSLEYVHFDCELNPFTNKPFFNEIVFFHKKSKTLFMSDVFWNYPSSTLPNYVGIEETGKIHECSKVPISYTSNLLPEVKVPFGTRMWKFGMDKVYLPFYKNFMVGKNNIRREKYEKVINKLLDWNPEVIVSCHGDVIRGPLLCQKVLKRHFLDI